MSGDRAREEIAVALATFHGYGANDVLNHTTWLEQADALLPTVRALMAEAAAEALEEAADDLDDGDWQGQQYGTHPVTYLRDRARALTTAHSEETRTARTVPDTTDEGAEKP